MSRPTLQAKESFNFLVIQKKNYMKFELLGSFSFNDSWVGITIYSVSHDNDFFSVNIFLFVFGISSPAYKLQRRTALHHLLTIYL